MINYKARLKSIENKLPAATKESERLQVDKEDLLVMDYEEFREVFTEWIMASYMEQHEKANELNTKREQLIKSLEPITKPSQFDLKAFQELIAVKIVDWMEANGIEDLDYDRWEATLNELEG